MGIDLEDRAGRVRRRSFEPLARRYAGETATPPDPGRVFCHAIEQRRHFRRHLKVPQKFMGQAGDMSPESFDTTPESLSLSPATLAATGTADPDDNLPSAAHPTSLVDAWAALFLRPPGLHVVRAAEMGLTSQLDSVYSSS